MSGGVDSSTAAFLLRRQGYDLLGCTMQLWDVRRNPDEKGVLKTGRCCSLDDTNDARKVAEKLSFPFYVLNFEREFERAVIEPFIGDYLKGQTPIPCTLCNTHLKFDRLLEFGQQVGADKVATGHYARIEFDEFEGYQLFRGEDAEKDQSYFLFELTQEQLSKTLFPVGRYAKDTIREIARVEGLVNARKPDSQEICFIPDGDYASFIQRNAGEVNEDFLPVISNYQDPGPILHMNGERLGSHKGVFRYTIGQRRGLGIAHPRPLYVMRLDVENNAVVVGYKEDVYRRNFEVERVNWISRLEPERSVRAEIRIRSNHSPAPAEIGLEAAGPDCWKATIAFDEPQLAVTPGQAAVFYRGDRVLGGGWISKQ